MFTYRYVYLCHPSGGLSFFLFFFFFSFSGRLRSLDKFLRVGQSLCRMVPFSKNTGGGVFSVTLAFLIKPPPPLDLSVQGFFFSTFGVAPRTTGEGGGLAGSNKGFENCSACAVLRFRCRQLKNHNPLFPPWLWLSRMLNVCGKGLVSPLTRKEGVGGHYQSDNTFKKRTRRPTEMSR